MSDVKVIDLLSESYAERLDVLWRAVDEAAKNEDRLAGSEAASGRTLDEGISDSVRLAEQYEALRAEAIEDAKANSRHVEMRLERKAWRELKEKHPPRVGEEHAKEDVDSDRAAGLNVDTASDDLLYAAIQVPEFSSRAAFDEWADRLTNGQFTTLTFAAWEHANRARFNPKALPASLTRSSATS